MVESTYNFAVTKCLSLFSMCVLILYVYATDNLMKNSPLSKLSTIHKISTLDDKRRYVIDTTGCRIKYFNPFDPSILQQYFREQDIPKCLEKYPVLLKSSVIYQEGKSSVTLDTTKLQAGFQKTSQEINCTYRAILRDMSRIKEGIKMGKKKPLAFDVPLDEEYIWVKCYAHNNKTAFYEQPLFLAKLKLNTSAGDSTKTYDNPQMNVLILGIDSMSRLNFHRNFLQTFKYLKSIRNVTEFFGYNKIGLRSTHNQVPLLTGTFVLPMKDYFDNTTEYIWQLYEKQRYATLFFEEQGNGGIFTYPWFWGFKHSPTTYWPRPAIQYIDMSTKKKKMCIGSRFASEIYLDYMRDLLVLLQDKQPLWTYVFFSEMSHDDPHTAAALDPLLNKFFQELNNRTILNSTAIVLISDHGLRFGKYRSTPLGAIEDMLPLALLSMPDWYYNHRPNAVNNLKVNSRRLVTAYDFHATFRELADPWNPQRQTTVDIKTRGYSVLSHQIIKNRTCKEAGVGMQFCACLSYIPANKVIATRLANAVVSKLNEILQKFNVFYKCHEWSLASIMAADQMLSGKDKTPFYKVVIVAKPGAAQFEAVVELQKNTSRVGEIDRIDSFRLHAYCCPKTKYERYCYCKTQHNTSSTASSV